MRLIEADALKHSIAGNIPLMPTVRIAIEHRIDEAPTIDAEPVVRCKDCKHWDYDLYDEDSDSCFCAMIDLRVDPEFFCADGERKDDDEE